MSKSEKVANSSLPFNVFPMSKIPFFSFLIAAFMVSACSINQPASRLKGYQHVLKDTVGWDRDVLKDGLIHYTYEGEYVPFQSSQRVDVLLIDLGKNALIFDDSLPNDSLSARAGRYEGALAAVNGTYYEIVKTAEGDSLFSSFFKQGGQISTSVTVPEDHRLFWKHEGAFYYDQAQGEWNIVYGDAERYNQLPAANALSGSPMLIYDHDPVGETFAKTQDGPLDSLDYEHPDRHQGVRHPRTALAITDDNHLLLITVDGRRRETAGMSAKELTQFIARYFKPKHALNIDGGGSTTMWIKGSSSPNGVVNYPTDNKQYDHFGQRRIRNGIIVTDQ